MTFDEYQQQAPQTALPNPDPFLDKTHWVLGIGGEAGEVVEKWKKILAYKDGHITEEDIADFKKELGDILWYVTIFADRLGLSLDDIAHLNLQKLADRQARNVIKGSGDNR